MIDWFLKPKEIVSANSDIRLNVGEQSSNELGECIVDPETRAITQVTVADINRADELFTILMGTQVSPRREYLLAHGEELDDGNDK